MKALPPIARAVSSSPDAYVYLAESIRAWPDQERLADRIARPAGRAPEWLNLSGGIVTLHRATGRDAATRRVVVAQPRRPGASGCSGEVAELGPAGRAEVLGLEPERREVVGAGPAQVEAVLRAVRLELGPPRTGSPSTSAITKYLASRPAVCSFVSSRRSTREVIVASSQSSRTAASSTSRRARRCRPGAPRSPDRRPARSPAAARRAPPPRRHEAGAVGRRRARVRASRHPSQPEAGRRGSSQAPGRWGLGTRAPGRRARATRGAGSAGAGQPEAPGRRQIAQRGHDLNTQVGDGFEVRRDGPGVGSRDVTQASRLLDSAD